MISPQVSSVNEQRWEDQPDTAPRIASGPMPLFGFIKYDLLTGGSQTHEFGSGRYGARSIVPRTGATAEDDGWLLTFVHDEVEGHRN